MTVDLAGKTFGEWTVLGEEKREILPDGRTKRQWICKCSCGKIKTQQQNNLVKGLTTRCRYCMGKNMRTGIAAKNQVINMYKSNAKINGRVWELSDEQFLTLSQMLCHYCYSPPTKEMKKPYDTFVYNGIDRKDNSVGYTLENSLPCCHVCNMRRGTMDYTAFVAWLETISNRNIPEYGMSAC